MQALGLKGVTDEGLQPVGGALSPTLRAVVASEDWAR